MCPKSGPARADVIEPWPELPLVSSDDGKNRTNWKLLESELIGETFRVGKKKLQQDLDKKCF